MLFRVTDVDFQIELLLSYKAFAKEIGKVVFTEEEGKASFNEFQFLSNLQRCSVWIIQPNFLTKFKEFFNMEKPLMIAHIIIFLCFSIFSSIF